MVQPLGAVACRVLGCLMEKEVTVPASYPMTLNGVVTACNQTSGRDPIMSLTAGEVERALDALRALGFTRKVHASHGARVEKHRHVADEVLELDDAERAVLTVLLLRGAQTPGDLRSRTDRLHGFGDSDEVAVVLRALADRPDPLVVIHDRRPGQKEQRWSHLLDGIPADDGPVAASAAAPEPLVPLAENLAALAPFVGRWAGRGTSTYPTTGTAEYDQQLELLPVPGKPFLSYRSTTQHVAEQRPLHAEVGFVRGAGDAVEIVMASGGGLVEIVEGLVDGGELVLSSTTVAGTATAKRVDATKRTYRVDGDTMEIDMAMAAVGVEMTHHLTARLTRA